MRALGGFGWDEGRYEKGMRELRSKLPWEEKGGKKEKGKGEGKGGRCGRGGARGGA